MKTVLNRAAIILLTAVCLLGIAPASSLSAADPVVLILEGEGSTPWSISNIAPGDSGVKTVTVRNGGTAAGNLSIWISNIVDREGLNPESETGNTEEPGELSDYLRLTVSSTGINTSITMPALLSEFPHSPGGARYIRIPSLAPGKSVTLTWEWELPQGTGNIVQGDEVSFDINYSLEQVVTPSTVTPAVTTTVTTTSTITTTATATLITTATAVTTLTTTATITTTSTTVLTTTPGNQNKLIIDMAGNVAEYDIDQGEIMQPVVMASDDGILIITIPAGTKAQDKDGNPITEIIIRVMENPPLLPENTHTLGAAYEFISNTGARFDLPLELKLLYSDSDIPRGSNEEDIYIAFYSEQAGKWIPVESLVDTENNTVTAYISHFSIYSIFIPAPAPPKTIISSGILPIITIGGGMILLILIIVVIVVIYFLWVIRRNNRRQRGTRPLASS